jgi:5-methyltetrahydropteroyltriglutamate--homocysteine methyltransferase
VHRCLGEEKLVGLKLLSNTNMQKFLSCSLKNNIDYQSEKGINEKMLEMKSCDVGSLPFSGNFEEFSDGASQFGSTNSDDASSYFRTKVVTSFLDKAQAGISIPYYPQFRDMNHMFLELIDGLEKLEKGYVESKPMSLKAAGISLPEVKAIKENSKEISEGLGHSFEFGFCVTGPYTLSSHFAIRDTGLFLRLARVISQLVENTFFNEKYAKVSMISVDEPVFGLVNDPLIDPGGEGRENLRKAWEEITRVVKAKSDSVHTCIHLHSTADKLFWEVESLDVVESERDNFLYRSKETKKLLEAYDKFLKANVCTTNFDRLIREKVIASHQQNIDINEKIKENWKKILNGELNATIFLEDIALLRKRILDIADRYGPERVPYASPECGLKGYPTYECALECLRRVASAARSVYT